MLLFWIFPFPRFNHWQLPEALFGFRDRLRLRYGLQAPPRGMRFGPRGIMPIAPGQNGCHIPEPASSHFLKRTLRVWNCFTLAFSVVSPVVGLYAIFGFRTWLPRCLDTCHGAVPGHASVRKTSPHSFSNPSYGRETRMSRYHLGYLKPARKVCDKYQDTFDPPINTVGFPRAEYCKQAPSVFSLTVGLPLHTS